MATTWSRVLPENLTVAQLVRIFSVFDLTHQHATEVCPQPNESSSHLPHNFIETNYYYIPSTSRSFKLSIPFRTSTPMSYRINFDSSLLSFR